MASTYKAALIHRALIFLGLFVVSLFALPLLALPAAFFFRSLSNFLFFWPQFLLYPYGFKTTGTTDVQYFFVNSAFLGAIACWLIVAVLFAFATRNLTKKLAALLAFPVMLALALAVNYRLLFAGYSGVLDGP